MYLLKPQTYFLAILLGISIPVSANPITQADVTLINASFNGVNDGTLEEFSLISNNIGNPAWNNTTGQASMSINAGSNGTTGCVSNGTFDGANHSEITCSFTINNIVDPDGEPTSNGHWVGLTGNNTELWNNSQNAGGAGGWALGIRFLNGSLFFLYDNSSGNEVNIASLGTFTLASLQDGYTVDYRLTLDGWEVYLNGLTGTIDAQGAWPSGFNYSIIANDSTVHASMTYQQAQEAGTIVDVGSISVNGDGVPVPPPAPNTGPLFPFVDIDGDTYRDEAELAFGADPTDSTSVPDYRTNTKPNIVIIYSDDFGFGEISAYADLYGTNPVVETPHMDSLVEEGVNWWR